MPIRTPRLKTDNADLRAQFDAIRDQLDITAEFPAEVVAEAEAAVADVVLPDDDATDIPFVTIDPEGSRDLDQALALAQDGRGHIVHYAIADLPVVVRAGGAIDQEARKRGQTMYAPDHSAPLHPREISEGAASLLPGQECSAYVWRFVVDQSGAVTETTLRRARVRSREQLSYVEAQQRIDSGDEMLGHLKTVGERRIDLEAGRSGASLDMPEEEVFLDGDVWRVRRRELLPVEQWNAQISLMTGMEAAKLQLSVGRGILRTMPKPPKDAMRHFRDEAAAIGQPFRDGESYGQYLRRLDRTEPASNAILLAARSLFRGAGYKVLDGTEQPADVIQAAIGAPYAHTTAPLRRLVDRYVLAHCEAIANGREIPEWAAAGLDGLPEIMAESSQTAATLERECVTAVIAAVLRPLIGHEFDALIVDRRGERAEVQLTEPPVTVAASVVGEPGETVRIRLESFAEHKTVFVAA